MISKYMRAPYRYHTPRIVNLPFAVHSVEIGRNLRTIPVAVRARLRQAPEGVKITIICKLPSDVTER